MKERWRLGWAVFLLIAVVGVLASLTHYALRVQHLRSLRDAAATEHAQLKATHQALAVQLSATLPPEAAAATARAGLGMAAAGEQPVRVLPATATPQAFDASAAAATDTPSKPPWYWWWQLFFGPRTP
ncbi:MAG: hypothetical protein GXO37_08225 [Chloroflexi bacterium]|nr:hypothetical protein [Chloroflexota bacterium]